MAQEIQIPADIKATASVQLAQLALQVERDGDTQAATAIRTFAAGIDSLITYGSSDSVAMDAAKAAEKIMYR